VYCGVGRFWRDLEKMPQIEVLNLSRTGFSGLARTSDTIKGDISRVIKGMGQVDEVGDVTEILSENSRHAAQIDELLERFPDSEPSFVRMTSIYATMAERMVS